MKQYPGMKDSGVAWIGKIPEGWEIDCFKHLFMIYSGATPKSGNSAYWNGNIIWITPADFKTDDHYVYCGNKNISEAGLHSCSTTLVPAGSIIFSKRAPVGTVAISKTELCTNQGCLALVPNNETIAEFYYYVMSICTKEFESQASGTTFKEISLTAFRNFLVPVPTLPEQDQIVRFLDWKVSGINRLISLRKKQIAALEELKKSVISKAVTTGLNPNADMKETDCMYFENIPVEWKLSKVLRLLSMPITDGPHTTPKLYDTGIPFVSAEAVSFGNGTIDFNHIRGFISQEFYEECCKKYIPQYEDIYMIKSGATTGKVAIVDTNKIFTIWSPLATFRCNKEIIMPRFMFYALQSLAFQMQVRDNWSYGTQQNIGMRILEQLKIAYPNIQEQNEIVSYLDAQTAKINAAIDKKKQQIELLQELRTRLISDVVTGKIDVRDAEIPEYEYAEADTDALAAGEDTDEEAPGDER